MHTEHLEIPKCPKCSDGHRYKIKVDRTVVMKLLTMSDLSSNEVPRKVQVTRIFTCPVKNEEFQAKFILTDTSSNRIKSVEVVGVAND